MGTSSVPQQALRRPPSKIGSSKVNQSMVVKPSYIYGGGQDLSTVSVKQRESVDHNPMQEPSSLQQSPKHIADFTVLPKKETAVVVAAAVATIDPKVKLWDTYQEKLKVVNSLV